LAKARAKASVRVRANAWLALGSFALASGLAARATGAFLRRPAWLGVLSGILLVPARFLWTFEVLWVLPYIAMWLWTIITCVLLIRRAGRYGRERFLPEVPR
jgi:hypothetical protein